MTVLDRIRRKITVVLRAVYHVVLSILPARWALPLQSRVGAARLGRDLRRPPRPLHLEGSGPVILVDCRGLDDDQLAAAAEAIATGPNPIRHVLVVDRPDFLGLRARGLSFEYIPPAGSAPRWFADEAAHAAFTERRLEEIRTSLGVVEAMDASFVSKSG